MRRIFIPLGLFIIAFAALAVLGSDRFVNTVLRPWATAKAATALTAEVSTDRLELGWGRLELHGVRVARPGELLLKVKRITIGYTLPGLWRQRLESLTIHQPDLEWMGNGKSAEKPVSWPDQPPLQVAAWTVEAGRLLFDLGEERLLLHRIEAAGSFGARFRVEAAAQVGQTPGVSMAVTGHGRWEGPPELTLDRLLWAGHSLLQAPVTVTPGAASLEATFALERLDAPEAARWLAALNRQPPWPPEISWQMAEPRLTIAIDGQRLAMQFDTQAGEILGDGQSWPWERLRLNLAGSAENWNIDAGATLPAQAEVQLTGIWEGQRLLGRWQMTAPSPSELIQAFGLALPPAAQELRALTLAGTLQATVDGAAAADARLRARWRVNGELSGAVTGRWRNGVADIEAGALSFREGSHELASASFKLDGEPAGRSWQGHWQLQVPDTLRLAASLGVAAPPGSPDLQQLELQGSLENAGERLVIPISRISGRLSGAGLNGTIGGQLAIHRLARGWRGEVSRLELSALEYTASDGLAGLTGGTLRLSGALDWQENLSFALRSEASAGEALAGSWYAELDGLPLKLDVEGVWVPSANQLRLHAGQLDLAGLASARVRGTLSGPVQELTGELAVPRLDGVFQARLRQLVGDVVPGIEQLSLAGGLSSGFSGQYRADGWQLAATVRPVGLTIAWGEALRLSGLSGELPLLLQQGAAPAPAAQRGELIWDELQLGPLHSAASRLHLTSAVNHIALDEPLRLAAGDGSLELSGLVVELAAAGPGLRSSLRAEGLDLADLSRTLGWPEMGGRLDAALPEIRFTPEEIGLGGEARLRIFDGEVKVANMRIDKPLSRYPTYHADLDFSGIDLQLLTRAFAVGEVNGIADGYIHSLRLFGTVPSAFTAAFETREKGPRNISVKAIRNLNTLSQGGLSAALSQGIYRFIDFYRYRKIGIRCRLRNDEFHLEGTAKPGTSTYLIDGGWLPPRIDVIVSTPTISFREMVRRLKRIERTGN